MGVINVGPDEAVCGPMGPATAAAASSRSGISWIVQPPLPSFPLCLSALGWSKECTVQLLPSAPAVVASCLSVSKHSSGCVATLRCVIRCLADAPAGPAV